MSTADCDPELGLTVYPPDGCRLGPAQEGRREEEAEEVPGAGGAGAPRHRGGEPPYPCVVFVQTNLSEPGPVDRGQEVR